VKLSGARHTGLLASAAVLVVAGIALTTGLASASGIATDGGSRLNPPASASASGIAKDGGSRLDSGEVLSPRIQYLTSPSKEYIFGLQFDCNIVLYRDSNPDNGVFVKSDLTPVWDSQTSGQPCNRAEMQRDGNLVLYRPDAVDARGALWESETSGHPGAHLKVTDRGSVEIRGRDGQTLWSRGR